MIPIFSIDYSRPQCPHIFCAIPNRFHNFPDVFHCGYILGDVIAPAWIIIALGLCRFESWFENI